MSEEIRLTRDIHNFVRGKLDWEESLRLLDEIADSPNCIAHMEIDCAIYRLALSKQNEVHN